MDMSKLPPFPGYVTSKQLLPSFQTLFKDLGDQDACIQLQEVSQRFLEDTARNTRSSADEFLKSLYQDFQVPHGTYHFSTMRSVAYHSFIILNHAAFEAALKEAIKQHCIIYRVEGWEKKVGGKDLAPMQQLGHNLSSSIKSRLVAAPEYRLIEYYRHLRIASSHRTQETSEKAVRAFSKIKETDILHFKKYLHAGDAPNAPTGLSFDDFKLFTRAIKYYSNLLNEALA